MIPLLMSNEKVLGTFVFKGLKPLQVWQSPKYPCLCPSPPPRLSPPPGIRFLSKIQWTGRAAASWAERYHQQTSRHPAPGNWTNYFTYFITTHTITSTVVHCTELPSTTQWQRCREEHGPTWMNEYTKLRLEKRRLYCANCFKKVSIAQFIENFPSLYSI